MKIKNFKIITISFFSIILIVLGIGVYQSQYQKPKMLEEELQKKLITIQIDGEEYLYGHFGRTTILVPKYKSCKCSK